MIARIFSAAIILTSIFSTSPLYSADASTAADEPAQRPKIGLALSGGGARGGAHVGVLKALEDLKIPVDYIAGTSMGAIIGGLYASGYTADEIEVILNETDWNKALTDRPARKLRSMRKKELEAQFLIPYRVGFNGGKLQLPLGVIEGQHLDQIFHDLLLPVVGIWDFSELPIPFKAIATDLVTGEEVVLDHGSLADSLRASMSVPGVFAPVRLHGRMLVDGGMANNLPVTTVRDMGADIVIAVDISTPLLTEEQLQSVLSVTEQLTNFLVRRTTESQIDQLGPMDILIVPDLGRFSSADFEGAGSIVELGEQATLEAGEKLARITSRTGHAELPLAGTPPEQVPFIVDFVEIENASVLDDELIRSRLEVALGEPLDLAALNRSMDEIYSLDVFEAVTYDLIRNPNGHDGIRVVADPRSWGPNYLQFGLELSSDFSGNSDFKLGAAYTRNALNSYGGELRVIASMGREDELSFDFYQPVDRRANWYIQPTAYWRRESFDVWEGDVNLSTLEISGWGLDFTVGRNFSTTNRIHLTYQFARADANLITGDPIMEPTGNVDIGEFILGWTHDSMDSLWFPGEGGNHQWTYLYASEALGASFDYEQILLTGGHAWSFDRNNFLFNYEYGYSVDDRAPIERWFRMGGFARLSGLAPDQLIGRQAGLGVLGYYRKLNDASLFPLYAGFTLEAGNVWDFSRDMSLNDLSYSGSIFFGSETPIGPVYVALGHNDGGDTAAYFYVGNPFRVSRFD